ncbi:uncharacterized protein N7482_003432 [Penicillium canariense]|uniref:Uncharacterized protein n=1 Tax=Penicillium canariense TaxID=189055 RepID=A0A9W9I6N4_9EURO|nr:uncharacterized protein N7482_003432 [Penicillium canariense]KAJ5167838.1 hypothetical protein N7482_003432 [Penicillium canariense]
MARHTSRQRLRMHLIMIMPPKARMPSQHRPNGQTAIQPRPARAVSRQATSFRTGHLPPKRMQGSTVCIYTSDRLQPAGRAPKQMGHLADQETPEGNRDYAGPMHALLIAGSGFDIAGGSEDAYTEYRTDPPQRAPIGGCYKLRVATDLRRRLARFRTDGMGYKLARVVWEIGSGWMGVAGDMEV